MSESGDFDSRKDSINKIRTKASIFIKLSFRDLCDSKLSGLHVFDNIMAIIN